ncbi:hypothetical protein EWM64_g6991 [Hericium alpestre]|uniref:Pyrroloquinoline quinone-dependent pyranose dehydrogenase beta-propeller domain-containing protein n=1 Tax=Hericium alpestre TaxID=135208 RepID=A0A4Y9ZQG9_9AGAM|nr:hypothetical protein EWM64_g6991 [Hericium alpestre]
MRFRTFTIMLHPLLLFLSAFFILASAQTTFQPYGQPFASPVTASQGLTAHVLFSNLTAPRGIAFDALHNLLVVERGFGVTAFHPAANGSGTLRTVVISSPNFTQGIQIDEEKLYLSTATEALLYRYNASSMSVRGPATVLVTGFNTGGELITHTLQLSLDRHTLLIASGVRTGGKHRPHSPNALFGELANGHLVAYGIRNPAGIAYSSTDANRLFIVENGASIDNVTGLTPAFVNDNPADEAEALDLNQEAPFFGFPDCTTMWNGNADPAGVPRYAGYARGRQFSLHLEQGLDDAWCQDCRITSRRRLASSVPLDIKFYTGGDRGRGGLPSGWKGDAFVSFHGSFDRTPPTGYGVVRLPDPNLANSSYSFVVQAADLSTCTPGTCIRPVGLAFGQDGRLYTFDRLSLTMLALTSVFSFAALGVACVAAAVLPRAGSVSCVSTPLVGTLRAFGSDAVSIPPSSNVSLLYASDNTVKLIMATDDAAAITLVGATASGATYNNDGDGSFSMALVEEDGQQVVNVAITNTDDRLIDIRFN